MDVFAEIIENGERTGLLGYREDLWKDNVGMDKRLVFKLFGEKLNWKATMDLMIARSVQLTLGARGVPVLAFSINANDADHMIYLERSANKWPLLPENFSFFSMDQGEPEFYRLRRDLIDLGGDYALLNQRNETIGTIDGRLLSFGKWHVRIRKEHANPALLTVLKLFCGMLAFNRSGVRHMRKLSRAVQAGTYTPKIEKQEADKRVIRADAEKWKAEADLRNHGLLSKAERALQIAGWSERARNDVEIFRAVDADGLTPLLMVLADATPKKALPGPKEKSDKPKSSGAVPNVSRRKKED